MNHIDANLRGFEGFGNIAPKQNPKEKTTCLIEGSLEVKLPTIWTDEKQRWEESEKRREEKKKEKESEERRSRCAKR